ncbi:hypothetical protein [Moorena sp. SIO2C4]|uniref:hypothetical protein n=1 Tax=Moorena sp. SIO2C4 TaxID=2607824 RepID=UPI0013C9E820|nr:hypothetical protein [Moorena sp. SIO2C4]NES41626.1 hypothetical protein [Moorena sp. SIO2C4]
MAENFPIVSCLHQQRPSKLYFPLRQSNLGFQSHQAEVSPDRGVVIQWEPGIISEIEQT